ncbi:MAG: type I-B CRISPR-associated protein Cas5b [Clostridium sp.]|uniref:type I-B CRISPR-associated protein Cas5b n=1 Tax=Clostridium sp. TaxID=1506 RepID=UPI003071B321
MNAIKFTLRGGTAFFKKPDVNSYYYFTYGCIHKVALLGMLGAISGYKGYNSMRKEEIYPEFYSKLNDLKIGIVPRNPKGYINKKVQTFNNSVGYASKEQGGNLIVKEQWLENPGWDIYILVQSNEDVGDGLSDSILELKSRLLKSEFEYIPYLGKNDHIANIEDVVLIENIEKVSDVTKINSIFKKDNFLLENCEDIYSDDDEQELIWKYEEKLPYMLEEKTNKYELQSFICTNSNVKQVKEGVVYAINKENIFFF